MRASTKKEQFQSVKMKKFDRVQEQPARMLVCLFAFVLGGAIVTSCGERKSESEDAVVIKVTADSVYVQAGKSIVANTFDTLRSSLLTAIGSQGFDGAISFCNEKADPITAMYADSVTVRRTAIRYRNPANKPDSLELLIFDEMKELMKSVKVPSAKIVRSSSTGEVHYFQPIVLQAMCVNCHGTPGKEIQKSTLTRIQQLYPDDRAVNFKEGDLRGLWHVIFNAEMKGSVTGQLGN
jgi:hypothetical protein